MPSERDPKNSPTHSPNSPRSEPAQSSDPSIESISTNPTAQSPDPVEIPIDGTLDLHTFRPRDLKPVLLDYIALCRERGILELRIIHGKGIGQLRATVHSLLAKHPHVLTYTLASEPYGGSGATIVRLKK